MFFFSFFFAIGFQTVPSEKETTRKIAKHFLGFDPKKILQNLREGGLPSLSFDAVFVIDTSKSISQDGHRNSLRALRLLIDKTNPETKFAAISYSNKATLRFNFTKKEEAIGKLNVTMIPFEGGDTNTQEAIDKCTKLILNPRSRARRGIAKRVLIITDGQSNIHKTKTLYRALQLKQAGAQVFVIAVGGYIKGINEIVSLASSTDGHLYRVRDTKGLLRIVKLIPPWSMMESFMKRTWLAGMLGKKPKAFAWKKHTRQHKRRM